MNAVDEYIQTFEPAIQAKLEAIRTAIKSVLPSNVKEVMNYGIPTYQINGNLVHFGGFKNHIGFYPAPSGIKAFSEELATYKGAKGSVQFPYKDTLPIDLIQRIVKYRLEENLE
ncbi:MAG: DUF1801 domain-containing protein [Marinoscillum sp.]